MKNNIDLKSQFLRVFILLLSLFIGKGLYAQPANDDPCNATPLTVGSSCTFVATTNVGATNTAGVPAPGCASYTGQDVWYSVVVPAGGVLNIDSNTGSMTDGGMAAYTGTCSSLTLLSCNDDGSANGLMPYLSLTGLTPGNTIWIRFWDYGGGTGTFSICVVAPPPPPSCIGNPPAGDDCASATPICDLNGYCGSTASTYSADYWSQLNTAFCGSIENNSFITFTASASTISFNVWVTSSTLGYGIQIFIFSAVNCTGTVTGYTCWNPGTAISGPTTVSASGLTPGNTYYIMIDGNSGDVCNYIIGANSGISTPAVVSPNAATICVGESVNLTASGGNGTYNWTGSAGLNTTTGAAVIATPASSGTYSYTVNSSTGNPLCPSSTSATATITVNDCGCVVNATNSGDVCPGGSVNLFASDVPGATYSWSSSFGFSSTNQNPTNIVMPTTPGSYDITVTATLNGSPCTSTTTVVVHPLPSVNAGLDQNVCQGTSVTLNGSGASTYSWSGGISNGVSFTPGLGLNSYTVTGTDAQGCTNTDQVNVTVNTNPTVSAGTYSPVCSTVPSVALAGTPSGGTFSGTGVSGNSFNTSSGTQTITYNYTDGNGCSGSATATITVNQAPVANAGGDVGICSGGSVSLTGSGIGTPSWSPGTSLSTTSSLTTIASPSATTTYTLTLTSNGCTDSDDVTVVVTQPPTLTVSNDASICEGDCIDLTVSGADYYSWDSSSGITDTTASTVNVCPTQTITYNVTGYVVGSNAVPNGDFSAGATGFSSDYVLNSDTQSEGTYFVTTNANLTHPGFTGVDHTTGSGNFMVVNGSATPNTSVWCQTVSVEPNTEYSFSTWVSTLAVGSPAVLQFSINGTNISNPFTAPAATGVWDEFYAVWNSGVSTSATICIVNQNTSAGGNDFGLDDIFFANICSSTESVTITVNPPADATITPQSPICEDNGTITFSAAQSGGTWSGTGITNTSTGTFDPSVSGAGTFDITYTIPGSCGDQDMVQILVNALPTADAGADQVICAGEQVTLVGSGATTLAWSNSVQDGVAFTPSSTVTYTLTATDGNGCVDQDQVTVTVNPLPNVNAGLDQTVCDGANVTLSASGATSYTWSNGVVDGQSFTPTPGTTTYTVSGTDANGCVNSDDVDVNVFTYPVVDVNADVQVGYPTLQVNFNDLSSGGDTYFWDFGNGQTGVVSVPTNQTMSYGSVGTYTMELTISNGSCQVSDTIMITVIPFPAPLIHVPNIFTPNQDGSNDEFFIDTEFVSELNVLIINRWGNTVAEITTPQGVWDGTINGNAADDGVYFFRYEATGLNGDVLTGHGNITLVR